MQSSTSTKGISADLPHAIVSESKLKREEWMLLDPSATTAPLQTPPLHSLSRGDDSLTDGYGDVDLNSRTVTGGVDFFSNLGVEHRPKKANDIPEIEKVFF